MRLGAWWLAVVLFLACGRGALEPVAPLDFGAVPASTSSALGLALQNGGSAALSLTAEVQPADYVLDVAAVRLEPGASATLGVRFTPSRLGSIEGAVRLQGPGVDVRIALTGHGTGASLSTAPAFSFHVVPMLSGGPPTTVTGHLTVANAGTAGSMLRLSAPRVDGKDLCVGPPGASECSPWSPLVLGVGQHVDVPLVLTASTLGPRTWTVTFPSDDALHPEVQVAISAVVEPASPCSLNAQPAALHLGQAVETLTLRHLGPGRCFVRDVTLEPKLARVVRWSPAAPELPLWLGPGERVTYGLERLPSTTGWASGVVRVEPLGAPALEVPVTVDPATCLVASPSDLDFGTVQAACSSTTRFIALYDVCSRPVVVHGARLVGSGGTTPAEFFLTSAPVEAVLAPGPAPLTIGLAYRPLDAGADSATLVVSTEEGDRLVSLRGAGDGATGRLVDTFIQSPPPARGDVVLMVDPSPSFVPKRAGVRANLEALLPSWTTSCSDGRVAVMGADGAPGATIAPIANDAGVGWFSSRAPGFVQSVLAAFDALPVGSEVEACVGPAEELLSADAGVLRAELNSVSVVCVTDALEHSPSPAAALNHLRSLAPRVTVSAVTGHASSTCGVEAADDGTYGALVSTSVGIADDICSPTWSESFTFFEIDTCTPRSVFSLTTTPAGPLDVRVGGVQVPPVGANGQPTWVYDASRNAVVFTPGAEPAPNARLDVSYDGACLP